MTLEEYEALRRMISSERESEGAQLADRMEQKPKKRKKSQYDRMLKRALKEVNASSRTKSGKLRKGITQSQVMKRAHKLAKKMMK
jgi:hypothetical protein